MLATATIAPLAGVDSLGTPILSRRRLRRRRPARRRDRRRAPHPRRRRRLRRCCSALVTPKGLKLADGGRVRRPPHSPIPIQGGACRHRETHPSASCSALLAVLVPRLRRRRVRRRRGDARPPRAAHGRGSDLGREKAGNADRDRSPAPRARRITVGSKNFTEQYILGEIYAQALEAAGYKVKKQLDLGSEQIAYKALQERRDRRLPGVHRHGADVVLRRQDRRRPARTRSRPTRTPRRRTPRRTSRRSPPTPFENTYRLGMTKETAEKLGNPTTISELADKDGRPLDLRLPRVPPAHGLPARRARAPTA